MADEVEGSPGRRRGARRCQRRRCRSAQAPRSVGPGLDPVVLVLAGRGRVGRRRSPPAGWSSTRPCRSTPRRSRGSARSGRARASRRSRRPAWLVGASPNQTVAWRVGLGRHHVVHPHVHAVGVLGLRWRSSRCRTSRSSPRPAGRPRSAGSRACSRLTWYCQDRPDDDVAGARTTRSGRCSVPQYSGAVRRAAASSRSIAASNCASLSWYGFVDAELGLRRHQVQRRIGDEDRRVVDADLAGVRRRRLPRSGPSWSGAVVTTSVLYMSRFGPRPCGTP